ncbi:MAG TPA: PEP-CTERM sorting domain-containing protein [Casimicrobiaceae bacterium]|nr:PEP-CTERM sorting domain-containing protein [Casimicrobiaceae bacterium]
MTQPQIRLSLRIVAAAFAFTLAGLAQAVIFNSHFDPLAFVGDGVFKFDDACLSREDGSYTDCNAQLLSASVDVTDYANTAHTIVSGTAHLDFGAAPPSSIFDVVIQGGTLVGVDSDLIGFVFASSCSGDLCDGSPWWIQWQATPDPVFLYTGNCSGDSPLLKVTRFEPLGCSPDLQNPTIAFNVSFTRVPEPGTLLLVAGGLFAAWRSRRGTRAKHSL